MLSMQHVLCGILYDKTDGSFHDKIGALVFPDAIRAYSGPRQYSHFEKSVDGSDVSWWKMPSDMKSCDKESVVKSLESDSHLVSDIPPCVLGEDTDIQAFYDHNQHLSEDMFKCVEMHLRQDIVFDAFVREQIDCSRKYEDVFVMDGVECDGKVVRGLIGEMEQHGMYVLAHELYERDGVTANQEWFHENVKSALESAYSEELADKTFGFMNLDSKYDEYITNHDWSHLNEGLVSYDTYKDLYSNVEKAMREQSGFQGVSQVRMDRVRMAEGLLSGVSVGDELDMSDDFC